MNITSATFIKGILGTDPILKEKFPQVAFVGRSNVGKSSVINSLTGRKNLVRRSAEPGKTQEINFFLINRKFYLVDLPGYGFAKLPSKKREKLRKLIIWYLTYSNARPALIVLIVDSRIGFTELDKEMIKIVKECNHPFIILANKVDTLKQSERVRKERFIIQQAEGERILFYSAKNGEGREKLLRTISSSVL